MPDSYHSLPHLPLMAILSFAACGGSTPTGSAPPAAVASVTVAPGTLQLRQIRDTARLTAVARGADGSVVTGRSFTWQSSDPTTVSIDGQGLATAISNGTATIRATTAGHTGVAAITVEAPPQILSVTVSPSALALVRLQDTARLVAVARGAGGTTMSGVTIAWRSSAPQHATVDQTGLVTAVTNGFATITAVAAGVEGSAAIEVSAPTELRVMVETEGRGLDPDGYRVVIDGVETGPASTQDTLSYLDLLPGTHTAHLEGHAPNCYGATANEGVSAGVAEGLVTVLRLRVACLAFPDDLSLTFTQVQIEPTESHLMGLRADTDSVVQLTFGESLDRGAAWSPDGSRLVFERYPGILMLVNADGTGLRDFTDRGPTAGRGANADWSPDGTRLAYDDGTHVFVIEVDGVGPEVLLTSGIKAAWSPDGAKVAVEDTVTGEEGDLFVVDADGTHRVNLTASPTTLDREPNWSPDGTKLVWRRGIRTDQTGYDLWTMKADGSEPTRLLYLAGAQLNPLWLPDGRVVFHDELGIGTIDTLGDGTVTRPVVEPTGFVHSGPAWRTHP